MKILVINHDPERVLLFEPIRKAASNIGPDCIVHTLNSRQIDESEDLEMLRTSDIIVVHGEGSLIISGRTVRLWGANQNFLDTPQHNTIKNGCVVLRVSSSSFKDIRIHYQTEESDWYFIQVPDTGASGLLLDAKDRNNEQIVMAKWKTLLELLSNETILKEYINHREKTQLEDIVTPRSASLLAATFLLCEAWLIVEIDRLTESREDSAPLAAALGFIPTIRIPMTDRQAHHNAEWWSSLGSNLIKRMELEWDSERSNFTIDSIAILFDKISLNKGIADSQIVIDTYVTLKQYFGKKKG